MDPFTPDPAAGDPLIGTLISGQYRVVRKVSEGWSARVYEAEHVPLERRVALKCLYTDLDARAAGEERLRQEVTVAGAVRHPHIVDVTDTGRLPDGAAFIVHEYLDGHHLEREVLRTGALPLRRALHVAAQLCDAIAAAHAAGIVHRDLQPEHVVLVSRDGDEDFVKVGDFGMSKFVGPDGAALTATPTVPCAPSFMAPEQVAGRSFDRRADLYTIGVILFFALTGRTPFVAESVMDVVYQVYTARAPPLSDFLPDAPSGLTALIARVLEKDPALRPPDCAALRAALAAIEVGGAQNI